MSHFNYVVAMTTLEIVSFALGAALIGSGYLYRFLTDRRRRRIRVASDGIRPRPGLDNALAPAPIDPNTGQHEAYWVLPPEDRARGFKRPLRTAYWHKRCGTVTSMSADIAETFARDPGFYGTTFCVQCRGQFPIGKNGEFYWVDGDEVTRNRVGE